MKNNGLHLQLLNLGHGDPEFLSGVHVFLYMADDLAAPPDEFAEYTR